MEISPENDAVFGFGTSKDYYDPFDGTTPPYAVSVTRQRAGRGRSWLCLGIADDLEGDSCVAVLSLDDAEEVAYRILYAVTKLREENQ